MSNFNKKLVCIQYPGIVNNPENAIKTLGGINMINAVNSSIRMRLELRFRPGDPYCKPVRSTKSSTMGVLLKIRIKKDKDPNTNEISRTVTSTEVMGVVNTIYKFQSLADFQYLPLVSNETTDDGTIKLKNILMDLIPTGMPTIDWLDQSQNYFLPPPSFSRIDTPQNFAFHSNSINQPSETNKKVFSLWRKKRYTFAYIVSFNHIDPFPTEPHPKALDVLKNVSEKSVEKIKKLFEEKPIWSKVELMCVGNLSSLELKYVLPTVAYYFTSGPWRLLWIKFGYDPRKDPSCRIYQNMNYRIRTIGILKYNLMVEKKFGSDPAKESIEEKENQFIFRPGILPPAKQMNYQYCNLRVPEIEDMMSKLGEILPGVMCHEKRGWLPAGFDDKCREIIKNYISEMLKKDSTFSKMSKYGMEDDDDDDDEDNDNIEEMEDSDSDEN